MINAKRSRLVKRIIINWYACYSIWFGFINEWSIELPNYKASFTISITVVPLVKSTAVAKVAIGMSCIAA
jgi:hypothetical protein